MPITIPEELEDIGAERDALMADAAEAIIPPAESPYNVKAMEALSDALKKIADVLGVELEVEEYTEAATVLDPQVQQFLLMTASRSSSPASPPKATRWRLRSAGPARWPKRTSTSPVACESTGATANRCGLGLCPRARAKHPGAGQGGHRRAHRCVAAPA